MVIGVADFSPSEADLEADLEADEQLLASSDDTGDAGESDDAGDMGQLLPGVWDAWTAEASKVDDSPSSPEGHGAPGDQR